MTAIVYGTATGAVAYGGHKLFEAVNASGMVYEAASGAAAGAATYGGDKLLKAANTYGYPSMGDYYSGDLTPWSTTFKDGSGRRSSDEPSSPPHRGDTLGDGTKCPDKRYEWKENEKPGSPRGNWVRGGRKDTQEILHPDLHHKPPVGPHWDYEGPSFPRPGVRLYPDGTWEHK